MKLREQYEVIKGEALKSGAERTLRELGESAVGRKALELYAFGAEGRIVNEALETEIGGVKLENPVMVGAGWDKKGKAIIGLQALGFAGIEVGTVPLFGQYGNDKPRLWTINRGHSVGINRMGFNSDGAERVGGYLHQHGDLPFPMGINIGLNKLMPEEKAPWAHAAAVKHIYPYASYIALGISSPNTDQVRGLQRKEPLGRITVAVQSAMEEQGGRKPLFYKIDGDQSAQQIRDIIEVALENNVDGIIAINTTKSKEIKAKYGDRWPRELGGLSGADPEYRNRATEAVRFIYEEAGDELTVIGVGGIGDTETALDKIRAGASAVQIVTAIRPSWGRAAARINQGLLQQIERDGATSIRGYIGIDTKRGPKT